jgi:hypothetical protein
MKKSQKKKDDDALKNEKIKSLEEMVANAQQTITSLQQIISDLQVTKNNSFPQGTASQDQSRSFDGQIIHGTFDGQIMIGEDGKQYPVPANYASKSKLIEEDMLKLTITPEGNFVYKQIGPAQRKYLIGIVQRDEKGNYSIIADAKKYKVLLAAATYFKIEPNDEVTLVVPRDKESQWAAIENILKKGTDRSLPPKKSEVFFNTDANNSQIEEFDNSDYNSYSKPSAIQKLEKEMELERKKRLSEETILDEWTPDIEALKKEAGQKAPTNAAISDDL